MALPININELIHGSTVEWERIEFKEGWNPEIILHTICAFANDVNNWGGGYLVIGIAEENGRAVLPPKGLDVGELDTIQKKLHELCHKIIPAYTPVVAPYEIEGQHILVVWVPGGETRPYKASRSLAKGAEKLYYVRRMSSTAKANAQEEQQLIQLAATTPFDDRINHHASIDDLSLAEIRIFLQDVKSDLFDSAGIMPFEELVRSMQIARGPSEYLRPVNAGLLKQALSHIKSQVIQEHVQKVEGQAEAIRFYNYPFQAVEEALANAVYHKNYEEREPIKVNILADKMEKYLNRRIGDFLRELHLTEGKGTGIPKIKRAMKNNESNEPVFETDDARSYFLVTLPVKPLVTATATISVSGTAKATAVTVPPENRRIPPDTTTQERKVFEYIIEHASITSKVAEELLGLKERRTRELLSKMVQKNLIEKRGEARSTHYVLGDGDD